MSKTCQSQDLKVYDLKDFQVGVTAPPFHPNCRTTTVPYFKDLEGTRIDGQYNYVPKDMNYKEWFATFGK